MKLFRIATIFLFALLVGQPAFAATRTLLTADTTFYVATTGNDATCDGSALSPCATPQHMVDLLAASYDLGCKTITVQLADGTYSAGVAVTGPMTGQCGARKLIIQGDMASPGLVAINLSSGDGFDVAASGGLYIQGLAITGNYSYGIYAAGSGAALFGNIEFAGTCIGAHRYADTYAIIMGLANYSIAGPAPQHYLAVTGGVMEDGTITVTLLGTPSFGVFAESVAGAVAISSVTFSGPATGQRYVADLNGFINTGGKGTGYFPGNAAGYVTTGGQYQ